MYRFYFPFLQTYMWATVFDLTFQTCWILILIMGVIFNWPTFPTSDWLNNELNFQMHNFTFYSYIFLHWHGNNTHLQTRTVGMSMVSGLFLVDLQLWTTEWGKSIYWDPPPTVLSLSVNVHTAQDRYSCSHWWCLGDYIRCQSHSHLTYFLVTWLVKN